jgi:hypothetical protein
VADQIQTQSAISPLLAREGANYALADPILKLRDGQKKTASKLHDAVQKLYRAKLKYEEDTRNQLNGMAQLIALYCRGEFQLQRNPRSFGYYIRPLSQNENRQQPPNLIRVYRHFCVAKIMATNPNVRISAGDDDPRSIASAQLARPMVDFWESQFYTARYNWRLALQKLNTGTSITRVRWNPFAEGPSANKQDIGEQEYGDQGFGQCMDCEHQGDGEDFQSPALTYGAQCPSCGSNAVDVTPPQKQVLSKITQGQPMNMGAPEISLVPMAACWWDLAKDFEESSWGIIRHRIKVGDVKMLVGDAILPDTESSEDRGLEMLHSLAYAGIGGDSKNDTRKHDKSPTAAEFWISPEDFAEIEIEGGKTVSGHDLPAGRMSDIFKEPICIVGLNDMSLQIGIFKEHTGREQIVTGQWQVEADSGAGWGINDLTHTQKRLNRWDGHVDQGLAGTATPTVLIDKRYLDDDQSGYLFKPSTTVKLNLTQLPPGAKLSDAMHVANPGTVNQQYMAQGKHLTDMLQLQSFAMEFSDQLAGVDSHTATGSQIVSHLAGSLYGPVSEVIGGERVRIAEIIVELNRKHDPVGRYYPNANGVRGRVVSGKDLKGQLVYGLMEDSQVPVTPFTKRQDQIAFVQGMGGLQQIGEAMITMPKVVREMAKVANVKLEAEDSDVVSSLCLQRLQQMEDNLKAGVTDARELVASINPQPSVIEPKHKEKREWFSDWLDLREGLEAPLPLRQAVEGMYALHLQLESQKDNPEAIAKGWTQGLAAAAAQAPAALGAQALESMQGGAGGPDQAAEQQHEQQMQQAQHQQEQQQQAAEQQHQAATQAIEMQHQRDLKAAEIEAENQRSAAEQTPQQKVAESLAYKDLPPDAQAAMLKSVGLPSSGTKAVHASTIAKQTAKAKAATKPVGKKP